MKKNETAPLDIEARTAAMMAEMERMREAMAKLTAENEALKAKVPTAGGFVVLAGDRIPAKERKYTFAVGEQVITGGHRIKAKVNPGGEYGEFGLNERWIDNPAKPGQRMRVRGIEGRCVDIAEMLTFAVEQPEAVKSWISFYLDQSTAAAAAAETAAK